MADVFSSVTDLINNGGFDSANDSVLFFCFAAVCLSVLLLKILLQAGYGSMFAVNAATSKSIKSRDDIKRLKIGQFARAANEFADIGSVNASRADARAIVEKNLLKTHFLLIFDYKSVEAFIASVENILPFITILFTITVEDKFLFALLTILILLAFKLLSVAFDVSAAREKYIAVTSILLEKTVGRFFTADSASAITALSNELKRSIHAQSVALSETLARMNGDLNTTFENALKSLTAFADSLENNSAFTDYMTALNEKHMVFNKSIEHYELTLQELTSQIGSGFGNVINYHLQEAYNSLSQGIIDNMKAVSKANNELMENMREMFAQMQEQSRIGTNAIISVKQQLEMSSTVG